MASEQMALQFAQIQEKSNNDLVKNLTAGLGKKLSTGFSSVVGSVKTMTKTAAGNLEDKLEARKAEKVKSAREEKWRATQDKFFGFMKTKWSSITENKKVKSFGGFLKKILIGLALFALPKDFWVGIGNALKALGKWIVEIDWIEVFNTIKETVIAIKKGITKVIEGIFGAYDKDKDGKDIGNRKGGLLGEGGSLSDVMSFFGMDGDAVAATVTKFVAGIGAATALLAIMFPVKAAKILGKSIKGLAGGAKAVGSKGLNMLAGGKEGMADRYMTDSQRSMSTDRASNASKAGPRVGKSAGGGGWFKKLMGKFGKAGKFLIKMGKSVITGLMKMGPWGWGIIAGIALGAVVYSYWDEIKAGISSAMDFVSESASGLMTWVKTALGKAADFGLKLLRAVGLGFVADMFEGKTEDDPNAPKKGLFDNVWDFVKGLPGKILGFYKNIFKKIGSFAFGLVKPFLPDGLVSAVEGYFSDKPKVGNTEEQQAISDASDKKQEDRKSKGKFGTIDEFTQSEEYKSQLEKRPDGSFKGISPKKRKEMYKKHLDGGKVTHGSTGDDPNIDDDLAMTEGTHKKVGVSQADMGGVKWNKINSGGRKGVEDIITGIWNKHDIKAKPTFTSGFRKPKSALSLANTKSKHPHGTAFDLRSKDVPSDKQSAVFADLKSSLGIWGQHEVGSVNAKKRTGEHFHFQAAAQGFQGVVDKATIFLVGEGGAEMVNVTPLNSPQGRTSAMNSLQTENAQGKMGDGKAPTIVSAPQSTTVNNQSSTVLAMSPTAKNTFWDNAT
jgi:hypothetical protein